MKKKLQSGKGKTTGSKKISVCQNFRGRGKKLIGKAQWIFRVVKLFCMVL